MTNPNQQNQPKQQKKWTQNRNQTPPPLIPKLKITGGEPVPSAVGFNVEFEVRAFLGTTLMPNKVIVFKQGTVPLGTGVTTNAQGTAIFAHQFPLSDAGKVIFLRVHLEDRPEEELIRIPLPETKKETVIEADQLFLMNWITTPAGLTGINVRVIGNRGEALKHNQVNLVFEGRNYSATTNNRGHAYWELPRLIQPNERITFLCTADNVAKACELHLWNAPLPTAQVSFHGFVARGSFITLFLSCIVSFFVGLVSLIGISIKTPVERLSSDSSSGIGWVVIFLLCLLPYFFMFINVVWYFFSTRIRRMRQERNYRKSRFTKTHSGDPTMENFFDAIKEILKKKKKDPKAGSVISDHSASTSSTGEVTMTKPVSLVWEIVEEIAAEGFWHSLASLWKMIKK